MLVRFSHRVLGWDQKRVFPWSFSSRFVFWVLRQCPHQEYLHPFPILLTLTKFCFHCPSVWQDCQIFLASLLLSMVPLLPLLRFHFPSSIDLSSSSFSSSLTHQLLTSTNARRSSVAQRLYSLHYLLPWHFCWTHQYCQCCEWRECYRCRCLKHHKCQLTFPRYLFSFYWFQRLTLSGTRTHRLRTVQISWGYQKPSGQKISRSSSPSSFSSSLSYLLPLFHIQFPPEATPQWCLPM